jgi:hypothetical protein
VTRSRLIAPGTISFSAEYGLTSAWQVSLEGEVPAFRIGNGYPSTLTPGIKRAWVGIGGSAVDLAVGAAMSFPLAGPSALKSTEVEPFVVLATDLLHGNAHLFGGLSAGTLPFAGDVSDEEAAGLAWHVGLVSRLGLFRLVAEVDGHRHGEVAFTPGIVWRGSSALQIGFAMPIGLTTNGEHPLLIAKVTYEFHGKN